MESFTELLSDAFSETSGPSFSGEDLDFENLNFDENCEEDEAQSVTTKTDGSLPQEATGETAALFGEETEDVLYMTNKVYKDENSDEEDFQSGGAGLTRLNKAPKEDYTSSEEESDEEGSASGDDEDEDVEKPGDLLVSVRCTDEVYMCEKEDRIAAGGQPLAPQSAENPQVSNWEQGKAESDDELSYFGQVPEKGSGTAGKSDASEEEEQESDREEQEFSSEPESGAMKLEIEELAEREADQPSNADAARAGLDFQCLSLHSLQNLITEVEGEECVEKMKEFSGEEHQDAGESFADYPSDFSSCEYMEDGARDQESGGKADASTGPSDCGWYPQQDGGLERRVMNLTWSNSVEDPEEMVTAGLVSLNMAGTDQREGKSVVVEVMEGDGDETAESDSYSSSESDDGINARRSSRDTSGHWAQQEPEDRNQREDAALRGGGCTMFRCSDDRPMTNSRVNPVDLVSWDFNMLKKDRLLSEFALTTEDTQQAEAHASGVNAEDRNSYSVVTREDTTSPSARGSLDDSFFFDAGVETSGVTVPGNDEYEDERNWEQEQERIKAFFEYYDDSDEENEREGRQTKVQFCADPLSQVIHYETDSDRDSLYSSSTEREDDQSSVDTADELVVPDDTEHVKPESEPLASPLQDSESNTRNSQIPARQHRCLGLLKLMLKMSLVTAAGLLMFWLATDEADWPHQVNIF